MIALEAAGVLLAVSAGFAAFLFWRLQSGPVSLPVFRQSAEFAIERMLSPHYHASIEDVVLARSSEPGSLDLFLEKVSLKGPEKTRIADLSKITMTFSISDLMHGAIGPRHVVLADPVLRVERGADRKLTLAYAPGDGEQQNVFRTLTGGRYFREAFQSAELVRAHVDFVDIASGRKWSAEGADARIFRTGAGYAAKLDGVFDIDGKPASLNVDASYTEISGVIAADLKVADAPVGDLLSMFYGPDAAIVSAPLTGEASITLTKSGEVLSSRLKGRAGEGEAAIGPIKGDISFIDFDVAFNPAKNQFDIDKFDFELCGSKGEFSGAVTVRFAGQSLTPSAVGFDLTGENLVVSSEGVLEEPLPVSQLKATGYYDLARRRFALQQASADLLDISIGGSASYARAPETKEGRASPEIKADLAVKGSLDRTRLLKLWPLNAAAPTREFIETRMPEGVAENIALKVDLPQGALKEDEPLPDDALLLTFDIKNATVIYAPEMTPLTGATGKGRLTGDSFLADGLVGRVGRVALSAGAADFTSLVYDAPVHYRFTAKGAAGDILGLLNEEPLRLMDAAHLDPAHFIGDGVVRADIMRPNRTDVPQEEYRYDGEATFSNLTVTDFYGGDDLTGAKGRVDIRSTSLTLTADAVFGDAPIKIEWTEKFYGGKDSSKFRLSGTIDGSTGDIFGVPMRGLLRGPVAFEAAGKGDFDALDALSVKADFTRAAVMIDLFGWEKPQGAPASGSLDFTFGKDGLELRAAKIDGEGVAIEGAAAFDKGGALKSASFPRFYLDGGADLSISAARSETGVLDLLLTGPYLNAGPVIQSALEGGGETDGGEPYDWGEGISIRARVDGLALREGATYRDGSLDFMRGLQRLDALEFTALTAEGAPLSVLLKDTGAEEGAQQAVEARTDDIGTLFRGVFGLASVRGGRGSMEILVDPDGKEGGKDFSGVVEARDFRILKAPMLARIFSAGSLTGLADLLSGDGIEISEARANFDYAKGAVRIKGARASGPSVGITAEGAIASGETGAVSLNGAVAPLYQVNSILGKAPIIGDLFVGREGEGIVALAYQVAGPVSAPVVTVNPLSALTPGIFRRMFEPSQPEPEKQGEGAAKPDAPGGR